MSTEENYIKKKNEGDAVVKTKVSHGKIETAVRVRNATSKPELDLEVKRLRILNEIDKSTVGEKIVLPPELKHWQQLIIIIGNLKLKSTTEISLAGRKLGYNGEQNPKRIRNILIDHKKDYFCYDVKNGWCLTNKGQNEFSRLRQII